MCVILHKPKNRNTANIVHELQNDFNIAVDGVLIQVFYAVIILGTKDEYIYVIHTKGLNKNISTDECCKENLLCRNIRKFIYL